MDTPLASARQAVGMLGRKIIEHAHKPLAVLSAVNELVSSKEPVVGFEVTAQKQSTLFGKTDMDALVPEPPIGESFAHIAHRIDSGKALVALATVPYKETDNEKSNG